ncbi:MAG: response regulator [Deltaproteobacteria bacterium]|nr:response regulator [Deltaproteobacteria bacterium]
MDGDEKAAGGGDPGTGRLEALASLGQLTASVSHEFNNILTAILGWAQLAMRDMQNPRTLETALCTIEANARRARRVVRDLLDSVRDDSERRPTCLSDVVDDALRLLAWELRNVGVRVRRELEPTPDLFVDRGRIQQILVNLMLNAMQAMPSGGELVVAVRAVEGGVEVDVADTGRGIDPTVAGRLFEPFVSTKSSAEVGGGSGLGLAVSRRIALEHGGDIRLRGSPGHGAVFTLFLPETTAPPLALPATTPTVPERPLRVRVLVIDDEADIRDLLTTALELRGATVESAADPTSALAKLEASEFGVVLLDYTLPGTNGLEVLGRMRQLRPKLPVYFMSGRTGTDTTHVGSTASAPTGWIRKPFDLEEVYREVARSVFSA